MAKDFLKFDKKHKLTDPRGSMNPKYEKIESKVQYNQIA